MNATEKPLTPRKILFIINHKSGRGGDTDLNDLISAQAVTAAFDFQIYTMSGNDEELIRAAVKQYKPDVVAVTGGDGTVSLLAGILAHTKIALSIIPYAKHLFGEMFLLKNYHFNIFYDDLYIRRKGVSITFANASKYGTGAVINPDGILDDGKFELVIVKPFPRIKLLSIAWKMFMNRLHTSDYVEIISCKKAMVSSRRRTTLQIDGEVIGKVKEINVDILPKALIVLTPAKF